jgi:hypothetical protein
LPISIWSTLIIEGMLDTVPEAPVSLGVFFALARALA